MAYLSNLLNKDHQTFVGDQKNSVIKVATTEI